MPTNFNYQDNFNRNVQKSRFDLSHKNAIPMQIGNLVPFLFDDVVPGDEINLNSQLYLKMAPMVAPQMSEIQVNMRYFYAPYRLLFKDFNEFYTSTDEENFVPFISFAGETGREEFWSFYRRYSNIYRHFGLAEFPNFNPTSDTNLLQYPDYVNLLPFRAYNQIYYWYYLNLAQMSNAKHTLAREALLQNGTVSLSYEEFANNEGIFLKNSSWDNIANCDGYYQAFNSGDFYAKIQSELNISNVAQGTNITDLKRGFSLQKFFDTMLAVKRRFKDYSNAMFGVAGNAEIDRPVYLGGNSTNMLIGDVTATSEATNQALGSYAGKGWSNINQSQSFKVPEFGYIIGIVDVTPKIQNANYQHKRIDNLNSLDIYHPEFENSYVDEVKLSDAYFPYGDDPAGNNNKNNLYGLAVPYNELRFARNTTFGTLANSLSFWNVINKQNLDIEQGGVIGNFNDQSNGTDNNNKWFELTKDLFAVETEPQIYLEAYNKFEVNRVLKYEVNQIIM